MKGIQIKTRRATLKRTDRFNLPDFYLQLLMEDTEGVGPTHGFPFVVISDFSITNSTRIRVTLKAQVFE